MYAVLKVYKWEDLKDMTEIPPKFLTEFEFLFRTVEFRRFFCIIRNVAEKTKGAVLKT